MIEPAETASLTALLFAELCQHAELPPGVVNIVTGAGPTGAAIVEHLGIDKIVFTSSTAVGKQIQRTVASTGKRVTLELSGKAANIIFDDAAIDLTGLAGRDTADVEIAAADASGLRRILAFCETKTVWHPEGW